MNTVLDSLLTSLPWPIAGLDGAGTIVVVNPAWAGMRPASLEARAAVVGANLVDLCLAVDGRDATGARDLASALRDLLAGVAVEVRSTHCPCHAGDPIPRFRLRAVPAKDHPLVKAVVVHEEIPVSERLLQETQRRCQVVTDAVLASGFVAAVRPNGTYSLHWSTHSGPEVVSGYTPDELDAHGGWISTVLAEDRPGAEEHMRRALAGRTDARYFRRRHRDGSIRWVRSVVHPVWSYAERRVIEIVGAVQDVTEWRHVVEDLRLHADIFQGIDLGLLVWRMDDGAEDQFRLVTANPAAGRLTGIDLEIAVGVALPQIFPTTDTGALVSLMRAVGERRADTRKLELNFEHDARRRIFDVEVFALPERCVGFAFEDVTDQRALEGRIRQIEKMETVGRLAGGLAHDFNNILTSIVGSASVVDETLLPGDPRRDAIRDVLDASDRGAAITKRLLMLARREAGQPQLVSLNDTVGGLKSLLRRLAGSAVELRIELDRSLPEVLADATELEQVLLNLAVNARQAMPDGGILSIVTRTDLDRVELLVSDTGVGMDDATRAKMFEPFFTTKADGTGLGLATVFGIVSRAAGEIHVETSPGRGSTFMVRFPAAELDRSDMGTELRRSA